MSQFNPNDYVFETNGFYIEYLDAESKKVLGLKFVADCGKREMGASGMREETLKEDLQLEKGWKRTPVTVKNGMRVISMMQPICGKLKNQTWKHEENKSI